MCVKCLALTYAADTHGGDVEYRDSNPEGIPDRKYEVIIHHYNMATEYVKLQETSSWRSIIPF